MKIVITDYKDVLERDLEYEKDILLNSGKISNKVAESLAITEYKKFKIKQDEKYVSDFDEELIKKLKDITNKKS